MKIAGLWNSHDCSFCVLENGIPTIHAELERYTREKEPKGDSFKLFKQVHNEENDIDYWVTCSPAESFQEGSKRCVKVSDEFNRALGRSLDLDEEILKFIDKDLGKFFGDFGLGKNQKRGAIDFVRREMKNKHNWKSHKTKGGKQLFKSKEEYLINEALQKFGKRAATDLKINK